MTMDPPAVSVVIPTYQRRELVREAIDSVLAQTRSDFEILVVDGGSTDGTIESLEGLDPRIVLERQPRQGPGAARNVAVRLSRAPIVAFLDSDNLWCTDHLRTVIGMLERQPEPVLASTCPNYKLCGTAPVEAADVVPHPLAAELAWNPTGFTSCVAVRRWAFEQVGGFAEDLPVFEDCDLWVRLAMVGPFAFLARQTVVHRRTPNSLSERGAASGGYLLAEERHCERLAELLADSDEDPWLFHLACGKLLLIRALRALDRGADEDAGVLLRQACGLWPALRSTDIRWRLKRRLPSVTDLDTYGQVCLRCSTAWPNPSAAAASWLRIEAAWCGLRARNWRLAFRALREWRLEDARRARTAVRERRLGFDDSRSSGA
jgi:hypothetical protein